MYRTCIYMYVSMYLDIQSFVYLICNRKVNLSRISYSLPYLFLYFRTKAMKLSMTVVQYQLNVFYGSTFQLNVFYGSLFFVCLFVCFLFFVFCFCFCFFFVSLFVCFGIISLLMTPFQSCLLGIAFKQLFDFCVFTLNNC